MTDTDSTILVLGPRGAGKSNFIERLAGPIKLQPNGVPTDSLRTISVSPYFTEGKTIKLVKFPGFTDESDTTLTDVELFIGIATFLDAYIRRPEQIRSIVYVHPADRSKDADVKRNITMLRQIVQGAVANIVVVTTGGDQIPGDSEESKWLGGLTGQGLGKPLRFDGTKLSALIILESATKKQPILLDLKNKIPWRTNAGKELNNYIRRLIKPKEDRDDELGKLIEEEDDDDKVKEMKAEQERLKEAVSRLEKERNKLGNRIDWEQAKKDNGALEGVIKEQRDSATNDWKAAYYKVEEEKKALQPKLDSYLPRLTVPIWANCDYGGGGAYMGHSTGELFHTQGGNDWFVRNSAGRFGLVWAPNFNK